MRAGDEVTLTRAASVQFAGERRIRFRVIREEPANTDGWVWLDGYQLDGQGEAVERRRVFVRLAGLPAVRQ